MAKPPTLGDRLTRRMGETGHAARDAAASIGAATEEVERWAADLEAPGPGRAADLAGYLGVDVAEVKRLVLRSQMRRVQLDIREGPGPARAAS